MDYNFASNMELVHTPGSTTSFFGSNLPNTGTHEVEVHLILVGDNVIARDSEPLIFTMKWNINQIVQ